MLWGFARMRRGSIGWSTPIERHCANSMPVKQHLCIHKTSTSIYLRGATDSKVTKHERKRKMLEKTSATHDSCPNFETQVCWQAFALCMPRHTFDGQTRRRTRPHVVEGTTPEQGSRPTDPLSPEKS